MEEREDLLKEKIEETEACSRRNLLKGTAALLVGGIVGRISSAYAAPAPEHAPAPPLPWKWRKLDPMEAGRRAYRTYLSDGG